MSHPSYAETTKSGPDSSPVPQIQPKTSGSAESGDADVKQKSTPGSTSKSGQETKSGVYASIHNPLSQKTAAPVSEVAAVTETSDTEMVGRPSTPISQITQSTAEQTTPRSEAGKRMIRFDAERHMRSELPPPVFSFMVSQKWCLICANEHPVEECPDRWREPEEDDVATLIEWVRS